MRDLAMVSTRAVAPVLAGLKIAGVDLLEALDAAGLNSAEVSDPEGWVAHDRVVQLWKVAVELTGDLDFGLRTAQLVPAGSFGVIEYAFRKSASLGEGIDRISRYFRLGHDVARMDGEKQGDRFVLAHTLPGARTLPRAACDFILCFPLLVLKDTATRPISPIEIWVDYPEPAATGLLQECFQAPIKFLSGSRALVFSLEDLDTPLRDSEPGLCGVLDAHAQQLLASMPTVGPLSDRVREILAAELAGGDATSQDVARRLKMSVRTLHRRLVEEGTTHKQLLEELRRDLASRYLRDPSVTISEAAYLLGFSEPSAFHRAFRRWTGTTPAEFRGC